MCASPDLAVHADMEAANDGVHLVDARHFLSLFDSIDDAAMAARGQNDEALAFDQIGGADLVVEVVGDVGAGVLSRRHFLREAAKAIESLVGRNGFSNVICPIRPVVKA